MDKLTTSCHVVHEAYFDDCVKDSSFGWGAFLRLRMVHSFRRPGSTTNWRTFLEKSLQVSAIPRLVTKKIGAKAGNDFVLSSDFKMLVQGIANDVANRDIKL
jgi:hypothetical protein